MALVFFFFQAEDGIRDIGVTGVQTCALPICFVGNFYAQWEWGVTDLEHVSVETLEQILREEVGDGWTEVSCHPGYVSDDYTPMYRREREAELRTLTDPRIRAAIGELGLSLESYGTYAELAGRT